MKHVYILILALCTHIISFSQVTVNEISGVEFGSKYGEVIEIMDRNGAEKVKTDNTFGLFYKNSSYNYLGFKPDLIMFDFEDGAMKKSILLYIIPDDLSDFFELMESLMLKKYGNPIAKMEYPFDDDNINVSELIKGINNGEYVHYTAWRQKGGVVGCDIILTMSIKNGESNILVTFDRLYF